ncbi:hypothetical protein KKG41_03010, partial [Patescibacteria group bacterium]|nr:hypothetical protein [Patescibacteria group bacterium]
MKNKNRKIERIYDQLIEHELKVEFTKIVAKARRYKIQVSISIVLVLVLAVSLYQEPFIKAAPETGNVEVTSDDDWNLGTLDDITVDSGTIEINGDGGANWIAEAGWTYRQKITFDASSLTGAVDNIPILIHVENTNTDFWNNASDRNEVRFG